MRFAFAVALLAAAAMSAAAQERPDFSGTWKLNAGLSDDVRKKVGEAAASSRLEGGGQELLDRIGTFSDLSIEEKPTEITIVHGEDDFRVFYFGRRHVRNDRRGQKLSCRSRFEGGKLIIEENGTDKTRTVHVLTLVPSRHQLVYGTRIESARLKEPLDLNLLYDQVQ